MKITCRSILNLPYANQLKPVAGKEGMDHVISWVYNLEEPHYIEWLKGGELVLITGLVTKEREDRLLELINALYEKNVAGIIINLGIYIKTIPQAVLARGDFLGLPIFEMPELLRIVDISQSICFAICRQEKEQYDVSVALLGLLSGSRLTAKRIRCLEAAGYQSRKKYRGIVIQRTNPIGTEQGPIYREEDEWDWEMHLLDQTVRSFMQEKECLTTSDDENYIWMAPADEGEDILAEMNDLIYFLHNKHKNAEFRIGVGNVFSDLRQLKNSVENAMEAIRIGTDNQKEKEIFVYDNMIFLRLFDKFEDKGELFQIGAQVLKGLLLPENGELLKTLSEYAKTGFQAKAAAGKLYIHENTMHYRLKKIGDILQMNLKDYRNLFKISLALEILYVCRN